MSDKSLGAIVRAAYYEWSEVVKSESDRWPTLDEYLIQYGIGLSRNNIKSSYINTYYIIDQNKFLLAQVKFSHE